MNRDNIDFTQTGKCCICGYEVTQDNPCERVLVMDMGLYKNAHVLLCGRCAALVGIKESAGTSPAEPFYAPNINIKDKVQKLVLGLKSDIDQMIKGMVSAREHDIGMMLSNGVRNRRPSFCLEAPIWRTTYAIEEWIAAKEQAFKDRNNIIGAFEKAWHMTCPICGQRLSASEVKEINDPINFRCPSGCFSFSDRDFEMLFRKDYEDYGLSLRRYWYGVRKDAPTLEIFAIGQIDTQLKEMCEAFNYKWERFLRDEANLCNRMKKLFGGCRSCSVCYAEAENEPMYAAKKEELSRQIREAYGWDGRTHMTYQQLVSAYEKSKLYGAEKHCQFYCRVSPDTGDTGICGATGGECRYCKGEMTCKICPCHREGSPVGNFLATHSMCQHYDNGKCLKNCGFNFGWKHNEKNLPTCSYRGDEYVFKHRGFPCQTFQIKGDIDLAEAIKDSKKGKSHR